MAMDSLRRRCVMLCLTALLCAGCASLPPGTGFPRTTSTALAHPEQTRLGQQFAAGAALHPGMSGFRLLSVGVDGFLMRMQMIHAAERTIDLQYFIFRGDETGQLLTGAVLLAADRGVRVRILVDDGETVAGDEQLRMLESHPQIELRVFNPFRYRGHVTALRAAEYLLDFRRLDFRMHNKLLVVDNAIALIGGRNIGDQYFQVDPDSQFADDDMFSTGPIAGQLSATFDEFWASPRSIPMEALGGGATSRAELDEHREQLQEHKQLRKDESVGYVMRIASSEPLAGIVAGRTPLIWARAQLVCDSPDKRDVERGRMVGRLMQRPVAAAAAAVQGELLMITPYLVPGQEGMRLFQALRARQVRVRILTSSLEAASVLLAQSGYMHYRVGLLDMGVELYEVRSMLGSIAGSGQTTAISRAGNYSLHAKMFVFDRRQVFIGSMNFDQRSMHLNTEIGLLIDSVMLAGQIAARFDAMVRPENAYALALGRDGGGSPALSWHTRENGKAITYDTEPARSRWQRTAVHLLSLLPLDDEL
jgi:putative cardiolipin synthase